jgi:hypothetical protein
MQGGCKLSGDTAVARHVHAGRELMRKSLGHTARRYGFVWRLLREVARVFPDPYIHIGGDEVDHGCWQASRESECLPL